MQDTCPCRAEGASVALKVRGGTLGVPALPRPPRCPPLTQPKRSSPCTGAPPWPCATGQMSPDVPCGVQAAVTATPGARAVPSVRPAAAPAPRGSNGSSSSVGTRQEPCQPRGRRALWVPRARARGGDTVVTPCGGAGTGCDPATASSLWAGRRAPGRRNSSRQHSPMPPSPCPAGQSGSVARPGLGTVPASSLRPLSLRPRLTSLGLVSCGVLSERGSAARPARRRLRGCPSGWRGGQGAAAMQGGRGAPRGHERGVGGGNGQHRQAEGSGWAAGTPRAVGARPPAPPAPGAGSCLPHGGGGGRQAGERSPSHMVGRRRSCCPGNS